MEDDTYSGDIGLNDRLLNIELCGAKRSRYGVDLTSVSPSSPFITQLDSHTQESMIHLIKLRRCHLKRDYKKMRPVLEELQDGMKSPELVDELTLLGGHLYIIDMIKNLECSSNTLDGSFDRQNDIKYQLLFILSLITEAFEDIALDCMYDDPLMQILFESIAHKEYTETAFLCLKNIMVCGVFDLRKIPNLNSIMSGLSSFTLYMLIKVIGTCAYIPEDQVCIHRYEVNPVLYINHSLLLNIPDIFRKVCLMLRSTNSRAWVSPSLHFLSSVDAVDIPWEAMENDNVVESLPMFGIMRLLQLNDNESTAAYAMLTSYTKVTYQTELLSFLCSILWGPRKVDLLLKLKSLGFSTTLYNIVNSIEWSKQENEFDSERVNPFFARKIQVMRMVINYMDQEAIYTFKDCLLLSDHEKDYLNGVTDEMIPNEQYWIKTLHDLFLKCRNNHKDRVNISCCIQFSMRVPRVNIAQYYERHGLMVILFEDLVTGPSTGYQSIFDLLSEMIKFRPDLYLKFNHLCGIHIVRTDKMLGIIRSNIIDANVFVRTVYITFKRLTEQNPDFVANNQDIRYLYDRLFSDDGWANCLELLINCVTPTSIHNENMCCLNSFLLLIYHNSDLKHLDDIKDIFEMWKTNNCINIDNTLELFKLWRTFYASNSKDVFSFESFSGVKIHMIKKLIKELEIILLSI
ncbi:hypothetical protein SAMD00019534_050460 [Acytostelium subglobosum LB1]|uniref:hypothetical protein n=1 Tax=Acytostelium subglobosum LB1 TaxID=1410327 RepID=UPI000644B6A5|nr:hypothetical protein SAMD00019534_050460 [Acytostelium subglobosum LB1]GAM21871.1 hypothetical protein SAMD00019534_050460 [Acytostelium subglobosum LB1]|eukprot:XP_012754971.1 hypothetical protein SAMD00019534_050460 [Acytostelium subglobosum LB1]